MLREIAEALEALTAVEPLLLVLEDLQWVDRSTVDLLSALARRRGPAQLLVIATKRPLDALPGHPSKTLKQDLLVHQLCREIALRPLSEAEIAEYLAAESPGVAVPDGLGAVVYRHSEGNPLFMAAALAHLTDRGFSRVRTGLATHASARGRPPRGARASPTAGGSADQPPACRGAAGVGGGERGRGDILGRYHCRGAELELETAEDICNDLARRSHLIRATGFQQFPDGTVSSRYQFVHALYRDVLYDRLGSARRARLHLRIGERLEALSSESLSEVASELADHFEQGSDWSRAIKYLRLAADASKRCLAKREAITFYTARSPWCTACPRASARAKLRSWRRWQRPTSSCSTTSTSTPRSRPIGPWPIGPRTTASSTSKSAP
jgi:hypothetical protein